MRSLPAPSFLLGGTAGKLCRPGGYILLMHYNLKFMFPSYVTSYLYMQA